MFIEFRPPLSQPGPYRFTLTLDNAPKRCEFEVTLPSDKPVNTTRCGMPLELQSRNAGGEISITGLTVGASPKQLHLAVHLVAEVIYNLNLQPNYSAELTSRADSKRFCGKRALVQPACIRGSTQCLPFPANCDGPEDCQKGKTCCASPESGHEYGYKSASKCTTFSYCLGRLAHIACHVTEDCPKDMSCDDNSFGDEYKPVLTGCRSNTGRH